MHAHDLIKSKPMAAAFVIAAVFLVIGSGLLFDWEVAPLMFLFGLFLWGTLLASDNLAMETSAVGRSRRNRTGPSGGSPQRRSDADVVEESERKAA